MRHTCEGMKHTRACRSRDAGRCIYGDKSVVSGNLEECIKMPLLATSKRVDIPCAMARTKWMGQTLVGTGKSTTSSVVCYCAQYITNDARNQAGSLSGQEEGKYLK